MLIFYTYEIIINNSVIIHTVPPDIDDIGTSSDVIVNENDDAKLVCKAYGHPTPEIKWLREDKKNFSVYENKQTQVKGRLQSILYTTIIDGLNFKQ